MNIDDVRTFNSSGISIVVPPEESIFTYNYYPNHFLQQVVSLYLKTIRIMINLWNLTLQNLIVPFC